MANLQTHYAGARLRGTVAMAFCGQKRPQVVTTSIPEVNCKLCCSKLWRQIAEAHYRAFPQLKGPRMRTVDRALRELERSTRTEQRDEVEGDEAEGRRGTG